MLAARVECLHPHESDVSSESSEREPRAPQARLRRLLDTEYAFVWRTLRRFGVDAANAEDAAQQVFLIVSGKLDRIAVADERRFLFGTVLRVAANARRSRARRKEVSDEALGESPDQAKSAEALLEERQARAQLDRALDAMSEDLRVVFTLFELEEMTLVEIAALLDVPLGTATSRLRRAREQFRGIAARMRQKGGARV